MKQDPQDQLSELMRTLLADNVKEEAIQESTNIVRQGLDLLSSLYKGERIAVYAMLSDRLELAVEVIMQTLVQGLAEGVVIYINSEKLAERLVTDTKLAPRENLNALINENLPHLSNIIRVHNAVCQILTNPQTDRDLYLSYAIPEGHPWKTRFDNLGIKSGPDLQSQTSSEPIGEFNLIFQRPMQGICRLPPARLRQ